MTLNPMVPTIPGVYEDYAGDRWILNANGQWTDKDGQSRPPHLNYLLVGLHLRFIEGQSAWFHSTNPTVPKFADASLSYERVTNEVIDSLTSKVEALTKAVTRYKKKAARANDRADKNLNLYRYTLGRLMQVSETVHTISSALNHSDGTLREQNPTKGVTTAHSDMQVRNGYENHRAHWAALQAKAQAGNKRYRSLPNITVTESSTPEEPQSFLLDIIKDDRAHEAALHSVTITATNLTSEVLDILTGVTGQTEQAPDANF